ncbi:MAG: helix-turn-helix domain-containing protein, partial [Solirubrobacteraceae bacterium]
MSGLPATPFDLLGPVGHGPVWGMASDDLNATLLSWPPGGGVTEHVNVECDVLVVVIAGSGVAVVDGCEHALQADQALLIGRGARRAIRAGVDGLRYLTVHRRRGGLQIEPLATAGSEERAVVDGPPTNGLLSQTSRRRLFSLLADLGRPASTAELARRLGLHPNGVRAHLQRLSREGLVERTRTSGGRGRPADAWTIAA